MSLIRDPEPGLPSAPRVELTPDEARQAAVTRGGLVWDWPDVGAYSPPVGRFEQACRRRAERRQRAASPRQMPRVVESLPTPHVQPRGPFHHVEILAAAQEHRAVPTAD